jgi:hypothetical protein
MSKGKGGETQKMKVGRFGLEFDMESKRSPEVFAWSVGTGIVPTKRNKWCNWKTFAASTPRARELLSCDFQMLGL